MPGFCYERNEETGLETESDFHSITHLFNNVYLALVLGQVLCWTLKTPCEISGATVLAGGPRHADESHSVVGVMGSWGADEWGRRNLWENGLVGVRGVQTGKHVRVRHTKWR